MSLEPSSAAASAVSAVSADAAGAAGIGPAVAESCAAALDELRRAGCSGAVSAHRRSNWSVRVRRGEVERIESAGSSGLHVVAYGEGNRVGAASATDIDPASARTIAAQAVELCRWGDPDQWQGLPSRAECADGSRGDLELEDPLYQEADHERLMRAAVEAEREAFSVDPRISNSHRSGAHAARGASWYATTEGVRTQRAGTSFGFHTQVVGQDEKGERQSGGWYTSARHLQALRTPLAVGREAGERAVRGFGWRRHPSGPARVVLQREVATSLLGILAGAVEGGAVYRGSSFLAGALGRAIAAPGVSVVDQPLIPRGLGTRFCDGEGVRAREVVVVEGGRLNSYLVDGYAARRLQHPYTGHQGGCSNLRLLPGTASFEQLLAEMGEGLLVTEFHGFGVDLARGTMSKGVSGFRVEQGRISHPVQEVTIAAKIGDVLQGICALGNDPLEQSQYSAPSLLIDGFTVGGA